VFDVFIERVAPARLDPAAAGAP